MIFIPNKTIINIYLHLICSASTIQTNIKIYFRIAQKQFEVREIQ